MNKYPDYVCMLLYNAYVDADRMLDSKDFVYLKVVENHNLTISSGDAHTYIVSTLNRVLRLNHK